MSSDMLQQIDTLRFKNPVRLINDSVENFIDDNKYDIIVMKQVLHHIVSREQVLKKLAGYLNPNGVIIIMTPNDGYQKSMILSILVDTFISKISFPMQPGPEIGSISDA